MEILAWSALGAVLLALLLMWMMTRLRYRISHNTVDVLLFGIPLRRIPLDIIESISKRQPSGRAQHWPNTFRPSHRRLVLKLSRGFFRNVIITPRHRYIFRNDLENAQERRQKAKKGDDHIIIVTD